ncbi:MAG: hypothetical protein KDN05_02675 [Verrucomicrobiae bacterium]|nr:hypothetical protein [Verrucomicrobiae bacterium]
MSYRNAASFGKRQEYIAVAELLRRDFDVYMTLVDDQQIDCVIRLEDGDGPPRYLDIQIKARSRDAKQASTFAALQIRQPRDNFWFIFHCEAAGQYWVMPSKEVVRLSNENKGGETGDGKNKGKFTIKLANQNANGEWIPRPKFREFEDAFEALRIPPRRTRR